MQHFKTIKDKPKYITQLGNEKNALEEQLQKLPQSIGNKHKRWRAESDIA